MYRKKVLEVSGIPIYYYRCPECEFIFTTAFDHFSKQDFSEFVYNSDYILVDPDYEEVRPRALARMLGQLFTVARPARILDYGGGKGHLAELLHAAGYPRVDVYDPFISEHAVRPRERYECILCFEVVEHSPIPIATFTEMSELLDDPGIIIFSTTLQPADIAAQGVNWWYLAPRNGHVSLYSGATLHKMALRLGLQVRSANPNIHALFRELPGFARHFI
jgi:2-polyprenyl-6-hydroxyphenyl methylase/3-demethylubiquinone-9 3-methyltransferase